MSLEIIKYALIRVTPDLRRGETVNVGVVAFRQDHLDVRLLPSLHKVRMLDPNLDEEALRNYVRLLETLSKELDTPEEKHQVMARFGNIHLSDLGEFRSRGVDDDERTLQAILTDLVIPPSKPRRAEPVSRLETIMRKQFDALRLLGKHVEDIQNHLVIPKYPVDDTGNLSVDFALRNGRWHVTETIDFSGAAETLRTAKFKASALKAITLDCAMRKLKGQTVPLVVYQAASDDVIELVQPSINLLSDYAERLYNYANEDERAAYFGRMAEAAGHLAAEH